MSLEHSYGEGGGVLAVGRDGECTVRGETLHLPCGVLRARWHPASGERIVILDDCGHVRIARPGEARSEVDLRIEMPSGERPMDFAFGQFPGSSQLAICIVGERGGIASVNPLLPLGGEISGEEAKDALEAAEGDDLALHALYRGLDDTGSMTQGSRVQLRAATADGAVPACLGLRAPQHDDEIMPVVESVKCFDSLGILAVATGSGEALVFAGAAPLPFALAPGGQEVEYSDDLQGDVVTVRGTAEGRWHDGNASSLLLVETLRLWPEERRLHLPPGLLLAEEGRFIAVWGGKELRFGRLHWVDSAIAAVDGSEAREEGSSPPSSRVRAVERRRSKVVGACCANGYLFWRTESGGVGSKPTKEESDEKREWNRLSPGPSPNPGARFDEFGDGCAGEDAGVTGAGQEAWERIEETMQGQERTTTLESMQGRRMLGQCAEILSDAHKSAALGAETKAMAKLQRIGEEVEKQREQAENLEGQIRRAEEMGQRLRSRVHHVAEKGAELSQRCDELGRRYERPLSEAEIAVKDELDRFYEESKVLRASLDRLSNDVRFYSRPTSQPHSNARPLGEDDLERKLREGTFRVQRLVRGLVSRIYSLHPSVLPNDDSSTS